MHLESMANYKNAIAAFAVGVLLGGTIGSALFSWNKLKSIEQAVVETSVRQKAFEEAILMPMATHSDEFYKSATGDLGYIQGQLQALIDANASLLANKYELHSENLFGQKEPERFFSMAGRRAFVEIDGKPVEECFNK